MEELFEYYVETDDFHLKYAKGEPAIKSQEFHNYNEFVFFINGNSFLISKEVQCDLPHGSIVVIPKEHFHQFCITQPNNYVRCILGFRETPELANLVQIVMDKIKVIVSPNEKILSVFERIIEIVKGDIDGNDKKLFIKSALIELLIYIKQYSSSAISKSLKFSPIISQALDIIDQRYAENLSVESIAKMLYVSPSTLAHKFSKEVNISIYQYIIKKRLSVANKFIKNGVPPTKASLESGFNDYSCFYRLYKKYYK